MAFKSFVFERHAKNFTCTAQSDTNIDIFAKCTSANNEIFAYSYLEF